MAEKKPPIVVVGLEKEVVDLIEATGAFQVTGVLDPDAGAGIADLPLLGSDADWPRLKAGRPELVAALTLDAPRLREKLAAHYGMENLPSIVSPRAYLARGVTVGPGCLIQRGVTVMSDAAIGRACKVNIEATVHHDCRVGDYCTLAPGCRLLGNVHVEDRVFIGAGAVILPRVRIGADATIGAGAVVTGDVAAASTVAGVPARAL